jgi:hypothetical protein
VKTSTTIALALATLLSGSLAAYAQTEQPAAHPHHHHYRAYHRIPAVRETAPPPVVVAPPAAAPAGPFGLSWPHIAPYPDNKGDEDGLSGDVNDCNKGCIDGNPE